MTPHHLHALAAAWSLHTARQHLAQHARDEAAQIRAERLNAADGLRSPTWGTRHASGGHGDPVSTLLLATDRPARVNRWAELANRATGKLTWLACQVRTIDAPPVLARMLTEGVLAADGDDDPLDWLIVALRYALPGTAAAIHRHLIAEDAWIRNTIGLNPQHEPLPGVDCPVCAHRTLYVQTAGPVDAWTVVCLAGDCRLCTGQGCRCGMPGAVEGAAHIWPRAAVIAGAVAGATPTTAA